MATTEEKQQTILDLGIKLNEAMDKLQDRLDGSFSRNAVCESGKVDAPQSSNILDVIIEDLATANGKISEMHEFIVDKVLRKIH